MLDRRDDGGGRSIGRWFWTGVGVLLCAIALAALRIGGIGS